MDFAKHAFWMESHTDLPQQSFWVASNSGHKARFVAVLQQVTCNILQSTLCRSADKVIVYIFKQTKQLLLNESNHQNVCVLIEDGNSQREKDI